MLLLSSEYSFPPRPPLCALLSSTRSGPGLTPVLMLLVRLVGFLLPPTSVQLSAQVVALPFCLFAPQALFGHPLVQRGLRHLSAGTLGTELVLGLCCGGLGIRTIRLLDRLCVLLGLPRRRRGEL